MMEIDKKISTYMEREVVLSIIIPVFNNSNYTKSLLKDLVKLPPDHEIVIVDNASTDDTPHVVNDIMAAKSEHAPSIVYVGCPRNLGFSRGCNKGMKHARAKDILFLNNDVRVTDQYQTWTQALIEECRYHYLVSPTGGVLDDQFNFIEEKDAFFRDDLSELFNMTDCMETSEEHTFYLSSLARNPNKYLSGWCLAGSREVFDKLILDHYRDDKTDEMKEGRAFGPWNEVFSPAFFEDVDLSFRARDLGIGLIVKPIPLYHFKHKTAKQMDMSGMYLSSQQIFKDLWTGKK